MADVNTVHPEFAEYQLKSAKMRDVLESRIKEKGKDYLPMVVANPSPEDLARYENYLFRAPFTNFTAATLQTLVGIAFTKDPEFSAPSRLEALRDDIDGGGTSIYQQAQGVLFGVLGYGRMGLLSDMPENPERNPDLLPNIQAFAGSDIYNWKIQRVNGQNQPVLICLYNDFFEDEDIFGHELIKQRLVLRMENGVYIQERYRQLADRSWVLHSSAYPDRGSLGLWDRIPFSFVGSRNNDSAIDKIPLWDIAEINLSHYLNAADAELNAYYCNGQMYVTGVDEIQNNLWESQGGVVIGAGNILTLADPGARVEFAQPDPNNLAITLMDRKESQIVQLGGRLVKPDVANRTATQSRFEARQEYSILSLAVANIEEAYIKQLEYCQQFTKYDGEIQFAMNKEFTEEELSAQLLTALKPYIDSRVMPQADIWRLLKKHNIMDPERSDDETKDLLEMQPVDHMPEPEDDFEEDPGDESEEPETESADND